MGTVRYWWCPWCPDSTKYHPLRKSLFCVLRDLAEQKTGAKCPECGKAQELWLEFPFGLNAGRHKFSVKAAYVPNKTAKWKNKDGNTVEFVPFMVILKGTKHSKIAVWLPYWHLVHREKAKYGQWTPVMDVGTFKQLLEKAQKDGYL
jgi:hypothetical protein